MKVLQITAHFRPNLGGVETHLSDLINYLNKKNNDVFVLTYRPLSTKVKWKAFEKIEKIKILRIPWISGLFLKLVYYPILEFLYLLPGLFVFTPFAIVLHKPDVIHAHGLVAGTTAVFWGKLFKIRVVISLHSIYTFPKNGLYRNFVKFILSKSAKVMSLSKQSAKEIMDLGVPKEKITTFTYWIDLEKFKKIENAKKKLQWADGFVILFVGRIIPEKGIKELLEASLLFDKKITLVIAGVGPLEKLINKYVLKNKNILFLGNVNNLELPTYYSAADVLIVPTMGEEGFGRVIIEALACGLPVIGANRGAIPEAMDKTVGELIDISPNNISKTVNHFYKNQKKLKLLSEKTRSFALKRYSERNAKEITKFYNDPDI